MHDIFRVAVTLGISAFSAHADAFCSFVDRNDTRYFNNTSQIIVARDGTRTVMSILYDNRADVRDFALMIPVPQVLQAGQLNIGDRAVFARLDAYSAPRLAQYLEDGACESVVGVRRTTGAGPRVVASPESGIIGSRTLGVFVEASYAVGEYDAVILSARRAEGLETWLSEHGYRISVENTRALRTYVRQGMKFFVARVNLSHVSRSGLSTVRPLQIAFDSEQFTLPLRIGMLNADGPQDLLAYILTRKGRVEVTNYRTANLPAAMDLPAYDRAEFASFYRAIFDRRASRGDESAVFTEYVWDVSSCDPCVADPLSSDELRRAGVFWIDGYGDLPAGSSVRNGASPVASALLTRLHLRYAQQTFPEDLLLRETNDRQPFQARYYLHRRGPYACPDVRYYDSAMRKQGSEGISVPVRPSDAARTRESASVWRQFGRSVRELTSTTGGDGGQGR